MTLNELIKAVDALSEEELRQLRDYVNQRPVHRLSAEERIRMLEEASAAIREGLTQAELSEMISAMNEEYIEPFDESEWRE
jgi:uncharacterized protein YeeX (DUF496 family)